MSTSPARDELRIALIVRDGAAPSEGRAGAPKTGSTPPLVVIPAGDLRPAFAVARAEGCTHALTTDHDTGEIASSDLAALVSAAREWPAALIVAHRPTHEPHRTTRRLHNFLFRMETGRRLRDASSQVRVYPLGLVEALGCRARGDAYSIELLTRAAWAHCRIHEVALSAATSTHPADCSTTAVFVAIRTHTRLLARSLSGWPHARYDAGEDFPAGARPPFWRGVGQWLNPVRAWRELRAGGASRTEMAAGIAVGVFIANLPAYGVQTLLALWAARRLHLHPVAVVAGSKASTPPVGPLLIGAAVWLGHLLLHGSRLRWSTFRFTGRDAFKQMAPLLLDWTLGSLVIGAATSIAAFFVANALFSAVERRASPPSDRSAGVRAREPETTM